MSLKKRPPLFWRWLLSRLSLYGTNHSVVGDFEETFNHIAETKGIIKAGLWYRGQVLCSIPHYLKLLVLYGFGMLINYLKLALRSFKRHKFYTVINITGLSIGLAAVILTFLYVRYEFSYDRYHKDAAQIYRIVTDTFTGTPYILGEKIIEEFPGVADLVRVKDVTKWGSLVLETKGKKVLEKKLFAVDPAFFTVFSQRFIHGEPETALSHPASLVLTESAALRYFGHTDPINQTVKINGSLLQVTAVIADMPPNSHFLCNAMVSVAATANERWGGDDLNTWTSYNYVTYFKLRANTFPDSLAERFNGIIRQARNDSATLNIQSLLNIHFHSHLRGEFEAPGNLRNIRFAVTIALILLLVAILNFMNLASAHSIHRTREVGMRKVLGAGRGQLMRQFIGEAVGFTFVAVLLALILAQMLLPAFQYMTGTDMNWSYLPIGFLIIFLTAAGFLTGIAAGSYPAFFAAGFIPVACLRGMPKFSISRRLSLRNILVGIQFAVAIFFVCTALIVTNQIHFMKNTQLGSDAEHIIVIELPRPARHLHQTIKTELQSLPGVTAVSASDFLPSSNSQNIGSTWEGRLGSDDVYLAKIAVDKDFFATFGIELLNGEKFSDQHRPGAAYIINETAARLIGDGKLEQALGKVLHMGTWTSQPDRIIGIVQDFHFRSMHRSIEPMVLMLDASREVKRPRTNTDYKVEPFRYVSVKAAPRELKNVLKAVQVLCTKFFPYAPDPWSFYDQDFARMYAAEQVTSRFLMILAITAVFLAGLGLLGLSIYSVANRRKEIGIRRVMGASTSNILLLFFQDLFRIHIVATFCAVPLVYYFMHDWLNNFAYRIKLHPGLFLAGIIFTAVLFFLTSSLNVWLKTSANPAESLRYE